jgi:chromosome segregation ATPase
MLESTFEQERLEFEKLLTQKQMQLEEKDRQIRELRAKLSATIEENAWIAHESTSEKAAFDEFRGKLAAQNKIIDSLKSRLASFANVEAERTMLKREIHHLEFRVQDLQRKFARAESLARPESEVLATLSEKVEDLHTRYYYRERQLDTLLDRLSMKTGQSFGSPRTLHSYGNANACSNNGNSSEFGPGNHSTSSGRSNNIDLGELSPSATLHLIPHRDIPEI